jgi:hypothetical protein
VSSLTSRNAKNGQESIELVGIAHVEPNLLELEHLLAPRPPVVTAQRFDPAGHLFEHRHHIAVAAHAPSSFAMTMAAMVPSDTAVVI